MKDIKVVLVVSTVINVLLLLLIWQGSVQIVSIQNWINPSIIATLIGGLGGALAGTWISGNNANKQWKIQSELEDESNKRNYNLLISGLLLTTSFKKSSELLENFKEYPNLNKVLTIYGEKKIGYSEEDARKINELFNEVEEDIWEMFEEMELVLNQSDELARSGKVDWDTYRMINFEKSYKRFIKEYHKKIEIIESTHLTKKELEEYAVNNIGTDNFEWAKKILKTYDEIVSYRELFMVAYRNIIQLRSYILKKTKTK